MNNPAWQGCVRWDGEQSKDEVRSLYGDDVRFLPTEFTVNASTWRQAGYGPVSEILLILDRLEGRTDKVSLLVAVSTRIIEETAKLWALRELLGPIYICTIGDVRDLAPSEDGTNLVRTTLQSVAGVWGSADEVCVLPHDVNTHGFSDLEAARYALAVTRLLRHESRFMIVASGLAGAEAIEAEKSRILREVDEARRSNQPVEHRLENDKAWLDGPRRQQDEERVFVGVNRFI
ncbi:MAG: hypothetical protein COV99_03895 [Bacteroidetes bacterium CG12_big_fil_rev_8_21_14_0_65_60_17]|nr:MAG: hypothetical protein COV99_03895 [Bacteroidetes bacterium CG12_big_fil_rev_8_21_14_0_65_60_17]